jgi:hypothetical protein
VPRWWVDQRRQGLIQQVIYFLLLGIAEWTTCILTDSNTLVVAAMLSRRRMRLSVLPRRTVKMDVHPRVSFP